MPAPTFVQEAETAFNTATTPKTSAAITSLTGDILVSLAGAEGSAPTAMPPTLTGETFTQYETSGAAGTNAELDARAAVIASGGTSETVSLARTGGSSEWFGANLLLFRGSDGIGAAESVFPTLDGAASLNITTTQANSALAVIILDWNAATGASRVWRAVNGTTPTAGNGFELTYFFDASHYTVYVAYYPDAGAIGAKTVGLTTPASGRFSIAVLEVKGSASAPAVVRGLASLGVGV